MAEAAVRGLTSASGVIIIGSDCPALGPELLNAAACALRAAYDAVCGPAADGGHARLGIRRFDLHLFEAMPWGTSVVMNETRKRKIDLAWSWEELPELHDIDTPADLVHVPAELLQLAKAAAESPR